MYTYQAVVELAHGNPATYFKYYPRAARLLEWENRGRNVERFLVGRQVLVVFIVFLCGRITTFDTFIIDMPQWVVASLGHSGFLGVIMVVIIAQLTPQVFYQLYKSMYILYLNVI